MNSKITISLCTLLALISSSNGLESALNQLCGLVTTLLNDLEPPLLEQGSYSCGNSDNYQASGKARLHAQAVTFTKPFKNPPIVTVILNGLDMWNAKQIRYSFYARNVTATGMELVCSTWEDSQFNYAGLTWVAIEV
ncbi:uncharacterized protein LOC131958384 [Physella acuta]|uniref:uncharacterized protein LOC131958384 n=1 Tax=Physella acuta TaxID=109671 RepID=UPI0027DBC5AC|nr:uncharacterized protein LOC131958384 [Physella acuta]